MSSQFIKHRCQECGSETMIVIRIGEDGNLQGFREIQDRADLSEIRGVCSISANDLNLEKIKKREMRGKVGPAPRFPFIKLEFLYKAWRWLFHRPPQE